MAWKAKHEQTLIVDLILGGYITDVDLNIDIDLIQLLIQILYYIRSRSDWGIPYVPTHISLLNCFPLLAASEKANMASCEVPVLRVDKGAQYEDGCGSPEVAHKLYQDAQPSSVKVSTKRGAASGFFLPGGDEIVTNAHVVKNAPRVKVETSEGKSYVAEIEKIDDVNDLALLKVKGIEKSQSRGLELGASTNLTQGAEVFGLGHPDGSRLPWISPGKFQATKPMPDWVVNPEEGEWPQWVKAANAGDPNVAKMAQAYLTGDRMAAVIRGSHGSSGSPLMDSTGKVVGVMSNGFSESDNRNLMLSVPVEKVRQLVESPSKYKFVYEYRSAFQDNPTGTAVVDGFLVGSSLTFPKAAPAMIGVLSVIDVPFQLNKLGNDQYSQPNTMLKIGTEVATFVGGTLSLMPKYRTVGRVVYGIGLAGLVTSDFLPYEKGLTEIKDQAGKIVKPLFWE